MGYVERIVRSPVVVCTWERTIEDDSEHLVVPDACVDLLWSGSLSIAGPDTSGRVVSLRRGARIVGVRFPPGVAGAVFGMPASELRDAQPLLADVVGRDSAARVEDALADGDDPHALLLQAVRPLVKSPDPVVGAAIRALDHPRARVALVARELGFSERQLQRRVSDAVGYGPKMLARVLRFRRLQALASDVPLAERALDAGYADQAHMTSEVRRLTGLSPVRFLKDHPPTAA
jgi:AraC-like DNA-binding protein